MTTDMQQAAEAMQAQVEEALGIDADTEVCAEIDAETDEPCVMLTAKAVKRLLELLADADAETPEHTWTCPEHGPLRSPHCTECARGGA